MKESQKKKGDLGKLKKNIQLKELIEMSTDSDYSSLSGQDKELHDAILKQQSMLQLQQQITKLTERCWDKCVFDKLSSKFDRKTEACINNCVGRFMDTTMVVANQFKLFMEKNGKF